MTKPKLKTRLAHPRLGGPKKHVEKVLLSTQIQNLIKNDIVTCAFEPGEQIAAHELAERYHTGTTPVREALLQLAEKGFIHPVPRLGYIVSPITLTDVQEIYEARLIIEPAVVRLAATRGTDDQLRHLVELAAGCTYKPNDPQSYAEFLLKNRELHVAIAEASGNQRLAGIMTDISDQALRLAHIKFTPQDSGEAMLRRHLDLTQAIQARDADRAERLSHDGIYYSHSLEMGTWERLGYRPTYVIQLKK